MDWTELVNIEPLTIDDGEPIVKEIEAFLDAVRTGTSPRSTPRRVCECADR